MNRIALFMVMLGSGLILGAPQVAEAQSSGEKRFLQKTSVKVEAQPVEQVLRELCQKHKIEVIFDPSVEANAAGGTPLTLTADGLTLGSVIDLACRSAEMTYSLEKGKLLISTNDADDRHPIVLQYQLASLGPIPDLELFMDDLQRMTSGFWEAGTQISLIIGKQHWDALPAAYKVAVEQCEAKTGMARDACKSAAQAALDAAQAAVDARLTAAKK